MKGHDNEEYSQHIVLIVGSRILYFILYICISMQLTLASRLHSRVYIKY